MITPSTSKIKPEEDESFGLDTAISAKKGRNFCVSMCNPLLLVAQARHKPGKSSAQSRTQKSQSTNIGNFLTPFPNENWFMNRCETGKRWFYSASLEVLCFYFSNILPSMDFNINHHRKKRQRSPQKSSPKHQPQPAKLLSRGADNESEARVPPSFLLDVRWAIT